MNDILRAVNLKLLLVLEDLDRTPDARSLPNEVASLVDLLRNLSNVYIVMAASVEHHDSVDLLRICDRTEHIT